MSDFDKRNWTAYYLELTGAFVLYAFLIVASNFVFSLGVPEQAKIPLALTPMIAFVIGMWTIVRMFRRVDELQRLCILRDIATAFAATAFLTFSYGFLETVGFPRLSMFWVWGLMGTSWALISIYRRYLSA